MPFLARRSPGHTQPAITLFLNVMLVLTIMFLLTARLSQEGTEPSVRTGGQRSQPGDSSDEQIILEYSALRYGEVADLINTAKVAGVKRVGVITPEMRRRWRTPPPLHTKKRPKPSSC